MSSFHSIFTLRWLFIILFLKAVAMLCYIQWGPVGLNADEAQYWTWGQELNWGYYSKPPGIAWAIRFGTFFLGDTEIGVRLNMVIIGLFIPLAVFHLARSCGLDKRVSSCSGIITALTPMGFLSSLFATTDPGFVLFWTLGCSVLARSIKTGSFPRYSLFGVWILLGALFKWPIYYLWVVVAVLSWFYPFFRTGRIWIGVCISLLGLLPSVYWNFMNGWPTFRHVWFTLPFTNQSGGGSFNGNPLDLIGAQAILVSPILFILLLMSFLKLWRLRKQAPSPVFFCGALSATLLLFHLFLSLFKKIQGNWCVYAYPPALVVLAWYLCKQMVSGKKWMGIGVGISLILSALIMLAPIPYKIDPFRQNKGWRSIPNILQQASYSPEKEFLFSDSYQMTSLLSFYNPERKRAYFLNINGRRKNQFSYWPSMVKAEKGNTGLFVVAVRPFDQESAIHQYKKGLTPYFSNIEYIGSFPLFTLHGEDAKQALVFKCKNYRGQEPKEALLY